VFDELPDTGVIADSKEPRIENTATADSE